MNFTSEVLDNIDKMLLSEDFNDKKLARIMIIQNQEEYYKACKEERVKMIKEGDVKVRLGEMLVHYDSYDEHIKNKKRWS